ncbi:ABC transporter ATP-binding protein [Aquisediminimonas profunda]|uniref:ABC transporter ATP-binding protein n=1 Tax=Aquisediminimonas profunda TaxID=1550733 RepID=UPI001C638206|nr:ABC transporter ATP-binding protein [Aquisediminimonas profunda]
MIAARNLSLKLGGYTALQDVSADFRRGRVTAVIGANGAGKTSLIRSLAGLIIPQAGHVEIDGVALDALTHAHRARMIGYLPQDGEPAWNISGAELVSLGRLPHRSRFSLPSADDARAIERAMIATDTLGFAGRTIDTLSGGERARIKMARVLAGDPQWILADEPLANLDPPHQRDMLALFRAAAAEGKGVVTVLHQLDAASLADDLLILRSGEAVAHGPVREVLTNANLHLAFGMDFDIVEHADRLAIIARV